MWCFQTSFKQQHFSITKGKTIKNIFVFEMSTLILSSLLHEIRALRQFPKRLFFWPNFFHFEKNICFPANTATKTNEVFSHCWPDLVPQRCIIYRGSYRFLDPEAEIQLLIFVTSYWKIVKLHSYAGELFLHSNFMIDMAMHKIIHQRAWRF